MLKSPQNPKNLFKTIKSPLQNNNVLKKEKSHVTIMMSFHTQILTLEKINTKQL
jgi:hypothetical protein